LKEDSDFLLSAEQVVKNLYTSLIWFRKKSNPEFTELEAHQFEARQNEHCLKLVEYDRAVPTTEADVMPTDPLRLETLFFIAGFYLSAHQFDLSIIYHEKAFALRQLIPIKDDPRKAAMEPRGLGLAYAHSGQSEKALAVFNRILESRDILDPHDVCIVMSNSGLAYNCQKTKMNEDVTFQNAAIANYQLVIQTYRDTTRQEILDIPGLSHYQEIYACQLLGGIYLIQKRLDDAINIYQHGLWRIMIHYAMRGLKLETFDHLEDHCRTTLYALGKCYQDKQELGIAYACFTQSLKLLQGSTEKKLADRCEEFIRALEPKVIGTLPFADGILSLAKPDPDTLKRLKRQGIFYLNHTFHRSKTEEVLLKLTGIVPKS
jgi:tetratricopeptide (TPR) repeat protein